MASLSRQKLVDFVDSLEELGWEFVICVLGEEVNGVTKPLSFVSAHIQNEENLYNMLNLLKDEAKKSIRENE